MPVTEDMRRTVKVQLRLGPKVVEAMDRARKDMGRSHYIAYLIVCDVAKKTMKHRAKILDGRGR